MTASFGTKRGAAAAAALLGLAAAGVAGQNPSGPGPDPRWLKADSAAQTAEFQLIAGLTDLSSGLNFNGYRAGGLTLTVPQGWTVVLHFQNHDPALFHSVEVIPARDMPMGPVTPSFPHAATHSLDIGLPPGGKEDVQFVAAKAGDYSVFCAVPGHGAAGMWIRFSVSVAADRPTLTAP